jgi:signal transduction histidine kinase
MRPASVRVSDLTSGLAGLTDVGGEGGGVDLEVDPEHFRRVLRDLWQAGSSLREPRSLRLEVATVEPWVEIRVVRDADPIDIKVLKALFEPFDLNDDGTGVTIGLYLARAFTVAHGGTIGVDQDEHSAALWVRVPRRRSTIDQA